MLSGKDDSGTALGVAVGILSVADAAEAIGVEPIDIQRGIARGTLKATRIGAGDWKVRAADLDAFLAGGAKDVESPELQYADGNRLNPTWFADRFFWSAGRLSDAIAVAAQSQVLSDADYRARATAGGKFASTIMIDLKLTPEIRALIAGPVDPTAPVIPSAAKTSAKSWGDLWGATFLHSRAAGATQRLPIVTDGRGLIWQFYDSPERYQMLRDAAINDLLTSQSFCAFSESRPRPASATGGQLGDPEMRISYRLRAAAYFTAATLRTIASGLAF